MEEVATLIIRVKSEDADEAKRRLNALGYQAKETETATSGLMATWKSLMGLLAGAVGIGTAIAALNKLVDTAKRFESLEAQLKTATGSAENAKVAFEALQDFATKTPYDLEQTVGAFIKLTNLGLTPSERALRSYGNTASALGHTLDEMILAVSNAAVGQFRELRQFGILTRQDAEGLAFTFQGTTTKVKNSTKDIEEYFIKLGESKFGNSMAEKMATLEGKISNLGDAWDVLFATISKAGAGDLIKEAIQIATDAISEFTDMIASGQLGGYVDALLFKFESLADGIFNAFQNISSLLETAFQYWTTDGKGAVDFIIDMFKNMPENIRAYVQVMGARLGALVEYSIAIGKGVYEAFAATFNYLIETATNVGKEIWSHLKPGASAFDYTAAQAQAFEKFADRTKGAWDKTVDGINNATDAFEQEVAAIMDERDKSVKSFDDKVKAADALRDAYERLRAAKAKAGEGKDRLEKFAVGGKSPTAEFEATIKAMRDQAQVIQETYEKRKQLIIDNTEAESDALGDALARNEQIYAAEKKQLLDRASIDVEFHKNAIEDQNAIELATLKSGYDEKQQALNEALDAKLIKEDEYRRRSTELEARRVRDTTQLATEGFVKVKTQQLGIYAEVLTMAGNMATQMSALVQGNNDAAKAMFVVTKAIAVAQAIVNTELAATQALTLGPIAGPPMAAVIRGIGYASVALIAAESVVEYGGKFETGGIVPGTSVTGDNVVARVNSGEMILTTGQQRQLWNVANGSAAAGASGGSNVTVNIINEAGDQVETRERDDTNGKVIDVLIRRAKQEIATDIRNGGGPVSAALSSAYSLRRGAA